MQSAVQYANTTISTIEATRVEDPSFHKALFTLWVDLENSLETVNASQTASDIQTADIEQNLDEIIDAQDHVAKTAYQSRAKTYEELLYKLAMWRSDTPDFETTPIHADRKDLIIYSVFRDLIKITGIEHVKTKVDAETNFLGFEAS